MARFVSPFTSIKNKNYGTSQSLHSLQRKCEEAFTFYKSVFGGEFVKIMRYKDLSSAEHPIAENDANKLMHIALPIGKSNMLLGSDVLEMMGRTTENDNRNTISISADSREEADKLF